MKQFKFYLKALFIVLTTSLSAVAAASGLYNTGTSFTFNAAAMSENGVVVGSSGSSSSYGQGTAYPYRHRVQNAQTERFRVSPKMAQLTSVAKPQML